MSAGNHLAPEHGLSGERYSPEVLGKNAMEHRHRYSVARELAAGKDVLDIACGEGYGSNMLAAVARSVTGVDIAPEVVAHARSRYTKPHLSYLEGSCADIPVANASMDLVVSFETIEHHDQHNEMMAEIRRVLRPDGIFLISSPDKREYSEVVGYKNEFHVKELYREELEALLGSSFKNWQLYGQRLLTGSVIAPLANRPISFWSHRGGEMDDPLEQGLPAPEYFVALASDGALPDLACGIYLGQDDALLDLVKRLRASAFWRLTKPARMAVHRIKRAMRG